MATAKPLGNFVVDFSLDSSKLTSGLNAAKKAVNASMKSMRAQTAVMNATGDRVGALSAKHEGLKRSLTLARREVELLDKEYQESKQATGANSEQTQKYADKLNTATSRAASLEKQVADTGVQLEKMKKQAAIDANPFTKLSKSLDGISKKAKSVGIQ